MKIFKVALLLVALAIPGRAATLEDLEVQISSIAVSVGTLTSRVSSISGSVNALTNKLSTLAGLTNLSKSPLLVVGVMNVRPGGTVDIPINLIPSTYTVAGIQADILLPTGVSFVSASPGPEAILSGKSVQVGNVTGGERVIVFGLNQTGMGQGTIVIFRVQVASSVPAINETLAVMNPSASDPSGFGLPISATSGTLIVR